MSRAIRIDILVNNAGFGVFQDFLATPLTQQMGQIDVNVRALVSLSHAFAPGMVAAHRGGIINVASTAAFQPLADCGCPRPHRFSLVEWPNRTTNHQKTQTGQTADIRSGKLDLLQARLRGAE